MASAEFRLGRAGRWRLNDGMSFSSTTTTLLDSLAGYPQWFVMACLTVVGAVLLWLFAKVLKWSLYLLMAVVLIGGATATVWLVLN